LIEEVARLYGYNKIPVTLARVAAPPVAPSTPELVWDLALDTMAALGFSEIQNFSFLSEEPIRALGFDPDAQPRVTNPLSIEQAILRPSLIPGLLKTAAHNQKQRENRLTLIEAGKVWRESAKAGDVDGEGFELAVLWAGPLPLHWDGDSREADFYDMKGAVETLIAAFGSEPLSANAINDSIIYHPGRAARIEWRGIQIGELGELHPDQAAAFDLKGRVNLARIDLKAIAGAWNNDVRTFKQIPKFPGSWRDIALVVNAGVAGGDLLAAISNIGGDLLEDAKIVDVYLGEHVGEGKKSLAIRLWFRSMDRTLTEEEIQQLVETVLNSAKINFGAALRA
jgi:phenylalanyl-tRNA synthetase beta chain